MVCAIIKVEKMDNVQNDYGKLRDGYGYKTSYDDAGDVILSLEKEFEEIGIPYKPYITGFGFATESEIWSKQRIIESTLERIKQSLLTNKTYSK